MTETERPLAGKVAVVTGGSGALGRAICIRLATHGAHVHVLGRDAARLSDVIREIESLDGSAEAHQVDLLSDAAVTAFFAGVPNLDILVNNAGGSSREAHALLWEQSLDVIDEIVATNLRAAMMCTMRASATMVASGSPGSILLIGSTVGVGGKARFSDYAATKAALFGYTRSAALELGPMGVTINCLSPGVIPRGDLLESEITKERAKNVLGRIGTSEDVAELASFLVSDRAAFITGQNFIVDGGRSLGLFGDS
ncbi:SDR family NAD(P)-dependent oxidoreductase [Nocardioides sp. W7]|uniref:SDR family NAD(P)-dependent oxidoreductase n=1 Tax=Nocardioides sp. W7 TaxID=2931390 RepID=UPI001FD371ED|nr:SDR family NAD(P)-dependent oxidoreductase [Nocardioides sp. W7]